MSVSCRSFVTADNVTEADNHRDYEQGEGHAVERRRQRAQQFRIREPVIPNGASDWQRYQARIEKLPTLLETLDTKH